MSKSRQEVFNYALAQAVALISDSELSSKRKDYLIRKITEMNNEVEECEPDDLPVNVDSVQTFISALAVSHCDTLPSLGMDYYGNILAAWYQNEFKDHVDFRYMPDDKVSWLFSYHKPDGTKLVKVGEGASQTIKESLSPYPYVSWF